MSRALAVLLLVLAAGLTGYGLWVWMAGPERPIEDPSQFAGA